MSSPPTNKESLPIPAELWKRLRRFDGACEIALVRTSAQKQHSDHGCPRVWVVTIRRLEGSLFQFIQHVRPTLLEALTLAVDEAEAKGWAG